MLLCKPHFFYLFMFFVCLFRPVRSSGLNQILDWTIVLGGSYVTPFIGAKPTALPKDFDLEKAIAQTPERIKQLAREQCEKQQVDSSQFSVVAIPDSGTACVWTFSLNVHGLSVQKLVVLDKKLFEPPYNFGQAGLAHEVGHLQHHHPQKGILGFLAIPLIMQYLAQKTYEPKHWYTTIAGALAKVCAIKAIELMLLGKLEEYQADGNMITYCKEPKALRNAANFLRTQYYQNSYVVPSQEFKKQWDNGIAHTRHLPNFFKIFLTKTLNTSLILQWKLLTNPHPHPFSRAKRLETAAEALERMEIAKIL